MIDPLACLILLMGGGICVLLGVWTRAGEMVAAFLGVAVDRSIYADFTGFQMLLLALVLLVRLWTGGGDSGKQRQTLVMYMASFTVVSVLTVLMMRLGILPFLRADPYPLLFSMLFSFAYLTGAELALLYRPWLAMRSARVSGRCAPPRSNAKKRKRPRK